MLALLPDGASVLATSSQHSASDLLAASAARETTQSQTLPSVEDIGYNMLLINYYLYF